MDTGVHSVGKEGTAEGPDVSIILVNYNTEHLIDRLLSSIKQASSALKTEIVVVDNGSTDNSVAHLRARTAEIRLIENQKNVGFARANNQAVSIASGRYLLLLNTDAFVSVETLSRTIGFMDEHPEYGVLGVKLVGEGGENQPSCRFFPTPWNTFVARWGLQATFPSTQLVDDPNWDPETFRECDWVPGCYYLTRKSLVAQIGLFDPRFFLYLEEVDHCKRVKIAGWRVVYYPSTQVVHLGGESAKSAGVVDERSRQLALLQLESESIYYRKHLGISGLLTFIFLAIVSASLELAKAAIRRKDSRSFTRESRQLLDVARALVSTRGGSRRPRRGRG